MKKLILSIILMGVSALYAQNYKTQGEAYEAEENYSLAAAMYEQCMEQDVDCLFKYCNLIIDEKIAAQSSGRIVRLINPHALAGSARAQYYLGWLYYNGRGGVSKDFVQAVYWYRKAAEQGHANAQNNLGICYFNGQGVDKDITQAVYWFRKAAEQGDAIAQSNLGNRYYNGEGVDKDFVQAVYWYRKAAEQGYATAQSNLGNRYYYGEGVDKDLNTALYWYEKAIFNGSSGQNKTVIEDRIKELKSQGYSSSRANISGSPPSITIVNNTGYTIYYVYIKTTASGNWGEDRLAIDQRLDNGQSVTLHLDNTFTTGRQYDIRLKDSDDDTYTKMNVTVAANSRIEFTFSDLDKSPPPPPQKGCIKYFGVGGNFNLSGITMVNNGTSLSGKDMPEEKFGYQIELQRQFKLFKGIAIQSGLKYTIAQGCKFVSKENGNKYVNKISLNYINFPINLRIYTSGVFYGQIGYYWGFATHGNYKWNNTINGVNEKGKEKIQLGSSDKDAIERWDNGVNLGLGFTFEEMNIELGCNVGNKNILTGGNADNSWRNYGLYFSIITFF